MPAPATVLRNDKAIFKIEILWGDSRLAEMNQRHNGPGKIKIGTDQPAISHAEERQQVKSRMIINPYLFNLVNNTFNH
jgi:hypothetical protein